VRNLDFSSLHALLTTVVGLSVITLIAVGIRLLVMQTVQQRRERENRQVNERLKTLIAAYKTLGGSFTGDLAVDPAHRRDLRQAPEEPTVTQTATSDRTRRIRDAVEAALSDIILLGTEDQVRLAAYAATELAEGRTVHTAELVISLRDFVRRVLDLEAVPPDVVIPRQGPTRIMASKGGKDDAGGRQGGGKNLGGGGGGGLGGDGAANLDSPTHHDV
jgi:type II secretory pathway pseudopilin PulG